MRPAVTESLGILRKVVFKSISLWSFRSELFDIKRHYLEILEACTYNPKMCVVSHSRQRSLSCSHGKFLWSFI